MFREKYRRDNELLKAPENMPEVIIDMANAPEKTKKSRIIKIAAAAAAACLVIAAAACLPTLLNKGRGIDLPAYSTLTISPGDLHLAEDYGEIYDYVAELNSFRGEYFAGAGVMTDGAIMEAAPEIAPAVPAPAPTMAATNGAVYDSADGLKESAPAAGSTTGAAGKDHSATNTQKEDVDEADIIKTDGSYIYRLTGSEIVIIDVQSMTVLSRLSPVEAYNVREEVKAEEGGVITATTVAPAIAPNAPVAAPAMAPDIAIAPDYYVKVSSSAYPRDIYVSGDRMAVLYNRSQLSDGDDWRYTTTAGIMVYDISDRSAPKLINDFAQSGDLRDSRLIDGYVYIISNHYVYDAVDEDQPETYMPCVEYGGECKPIAPGSVSILPEVNSSCYTVMTAVSLLTGDPGESTKAAFGSSCTVYADSDGVILACNSGSQGMEETQINGENVTVTSGSDATTLVCFDIGHGIIAQTTSGEVPGSLLNQFSIDRHNGIVRVVTTNYVWEQRIFTDGVDRYEYIDSTTNGLYTLDGDMNIIGRLDGLAEDERVYSVRFSGDIGYFVTFRQVDPLFAVDLSDPAKPAILSALKIPGFSQYMHPFADGLLLGLGMDADPETGATNGLKLSMFDISDPADVTEKHKLIFDDIWWSEGLNNHRAVLVSAQKNIIAFPVDTGYIICDYSADSGFGIRHRLTLDYWGGNTRGLFIGNSFYICTDTMLYRFDIDTFAATGELEIAQRAENMIYGAVIFD